ncbi:MAG: hypothetical protein K2O85_06270 [Helicobacter sp.]|nr:hypothetical protein [Helicobacter sp.]
MGSFIILKSANGRKSPNNRETKEMQRYRSTDKMGAGSIGKIPPLQGALSQSNAFEHLMLLARKPSQ